MRLLITFMILGVSCAAPVVNRVDSGTTQTNANSKAPSQLITPGSSPAPAKIPASGPATADSESVSPPGNVSGALLTCSVLFPASTANPTTGVGCRFGSVDGARVPLTAVAEIANFDGVPPTGISMAIIPNPNIDWEVLYNFTAANPAASEQGAQATKIILNLKNTKDGQASANLEVQLSQVDYPLLEAWAPVCKGIDCAYREVSTGLTWSPSQGQSPDWDSAKARCDALVFAGLSDWKLPSLLESQKALSDKISSLANPIRLNLQLGTRYWTETLTAQGSLDAYTLDWFLPDLKSVLALPISSGNQDVICVQ